MKPISPLQEIVSLDPEKIDLGDKDAIKKLMQKLLNLIEMQAKIPPNDILYIRLKSQY